MSIALETMLIATPGTCGGRPRINGTRISVQQIAAQFKRGLSAEDIEQVYEHLSLAQVYAALAYYLANREEIDAALAEEETLYDQLKQGCSQEVQ